MVCVLVSFRAEFLVRLGVPADRGAFWAMALCAADSVGLAVALPLVDSWGRRPLLFLGFAGMVPSLLAMAVISLCDPSGALWEVQLALATLFLLLYDTGPGRRVCTAHGE